MSLGTTRSVAQQAQVQTVSVHWPSTGIGTFSSDEQVHWSPLSLASHWAIAVYCVLHFVMALTVASASFTQAVWQSATGQAPGAWAAHIAAQAWSKVWPVPEAPAALPPEPVLPPTPPAPPDRDVPPAAPPAAALPPLETVPPDPTRDPPTAVVPPLGATPPVVFVPPVADDPPVANVPPLAEAPPLAVTPPLADVPPLAEAPPFTATPPVAVTPPAADEPPEPGDPPPEAGVPPLPPCEQAIRPTSVESASVGKQRVLVMVLLFVDRDTLPAFRVNAVVSTTQLTRAKAARVALRPWAGLRPGAGQVSALDPP
jgi:hypothetical protein